MLVGVKGMSPIIAIVLTVAFTTVTGGVVYTFLSGYTQVQTEPLENKSTVLGSCSDTNLVIERVMWEDPKLTVLVKNNGKSSFTGLTTSVLLNDGSTVQNSSANDKLSSGELKSFTVESVNKPFERVSFFGTACPGFRAEKAYTFTEKTTTGTAGPSNTTATVSNSGDVDIRPHVNIQA